MASNYDNMAMSKVNDDKQQHSSKGTRWHLIIHEMVNFCRRTSIDGLSRMVECRHQPALRSLWFCGVLGSAVITIYQLVTIGLKYAEYQANVVVYQQDQNPEFPDITVCKINPYSHPWHVPAEPTYGEYLHLVSRLQSDVKNINSSEFAWSKLNTSNLNSIFRMLNSPSGYFSNLLLSRDELNVSESTMVVDVGYYTWNLDLLEDSRFSVNSTVTLHYNPNYQVCYRFRVPQSDATNVRALSGIFYLHDFPNDSISTFDSNIRVSQSSGVVVILHARGTYPDQLLSIQVPPGAETTISMEASVTRRLGSPYDNCQNIELVELIETFTYLLSTVVIPA